MYSPGWTLNTLLPIVIYNDMAKDLAIQGDFYYTGNCLQLSSLSF